VVVKHSIFLSSKVRDLHLDVLKGQFESFDSFSSWLEGMILNYLNPVIIDRGQELTAQNLIKIVDSLESSLTGLSGKVVLLEERASANFVIMMVALLRVGAIIAPVSPSIPEMEHQSMAKLIGAYAVMRPKAGQPLKEFEIEILSTFTPVVVPSSMLAGPGFVRFTSGTTGVAKGVCISARAAHARAVSCAAAFSLSAEDQVLLMVPMEQHFVASLLAFLASGVTINIPTHRILDSDEYKNVSIIFAAPIDVRVLSAGSRSGLVNLRLTIATTGPITDEECQRFHSVTGVPVSRVYGAIEVGLALGNIGAVSKLSESLGYPFPGFQIKICEGPYKGQLAFRGTGISDGYITSDLESDSPLQDGWFITSDLAEQLSDESYRIIGRVNSVINVAGYKVFPEEVEGVLRAHPDVLDVRVHGVVHGLLGQIVCADVVTTDGVSLKEATLRKFCRSRLNQYKIPQYFNFVSSLPKTLSGKIRRWT